LKINSIKLLFVNIRSLHLDLRNATSNKNKLRMYREKHVVIVAYFYFYFEGIYHECSRNGVN